MDESTKPEDDGLFKRHPRLWIYLIAGIFYLILFAMLITVLVLIVYKTQG